MRDKRVPRPSLALDEMVEVCASVHHCQGPDDLSNGDEGKAEDGGEEGNVPLEAREEVELDQGFEDGCAMGNVVRGAISGEEECCCGVSKLAQSIYLGCRVPT